MRQFQIFLKNNKAKSYTSSLTALIFLNLLAFLFLAYISKNSEDRNKNLFAAGCIAISVLLYLLIKNRKRATFRSAAVLIAILFYIWLHYYWLAIAMIILSLLFMLAIRSLIVHVSQEVISYPSFPGKKIDWQQLTNILIKDGLLTIDFRNDKLIQQPIDENKTSVNEQEFNEFCRQQLIISNQK